MSNPITVQFEDGSSHVYEDVPDGVGEQEIKDRAFQEYAKTAVSVQSPQQKAAEAKAIEPSLGEKAIGMAQVPFQFATEHPGMAAGAAGLYKANKLANAYLDKTKLETEAAKFAEQGIRSREMAQAAQANRMGASTITPNYNAPGATGPVAPTPTAPTTAARMPQPSMIDHASNIVRKLALGKLLPAAEVGMNLLGTSQDEIDTLKKAEALKRAQGWKPLNER